MVILSIYLYALLTFNKHKKSNRICLDFSKFVCHGNNTIIFLKKMKIQTWGRQSGRDSKITRRTPIGAVIFFRIRLSLIFVVCRTRPMVSSHDAAIWRNPVASVCSLDNESSRRDTRTSDRSISKKVVIQDMIILSII